MNNMTINEFLKSMCRSERGTKLNKINKLLITNHFLLDVDSRQPARAIGKPVELRKLVGGYSHN